MKTFFIAGVQRSGTTMLSVTLGKHPEIDIDGKSIAFRLVSCFSYYKDVLPYNLSHSKAEILSWLIENDYKGRLAELLDTKNAGQYPDARALIQDGIEARLAARGKTVFGDKSPNLEFFIPPLLMLVPDAKFIHVVRDGRAVVASQMKRAHRNLQMAAQDWVDGNIMGLANQAMIGEERYKIVRYEDLLQKPEQIAKELCAFLELDFDPIMLVEEAELQDKDAYVKPTFDTSRINSFQQDLKPEQLKKIEKIQHPLLKRFGYETAFPVPTKPHRPLSPIQRIWYNQLENIQQLFIGKRIGMMDRKNVAVRVPLRTRIKTFVFQLGRDLLPERVYKRAFRSRWIKEVYLKKEKQPSDNKQA